MRMKQLNCKYPAQTLRQTHSHPRRRACLPKEWPNTKKKEEEKERNSTKMKITKNDCQHVEDVAALASPSPAAAAASTVRQLQRAGPGGSGGGQECEMPPRRAKVQ